MGLLDFFKRRQRKQEATNDEDLDHLPDMQPQADGELAKAAMRAHEASASSAPELQPTLAHVETEGLPSVNRRRGGNQLLNALGIVTIIGIGIALIVAVNSTKSRDAPKKRQTPAQETVANTLPPLALPAPPPIQVAHDGVPGPARQGAHQVPAIDASAKPIPVHPYGAQPQGSTQRPLDWKDRKLAGSLVLSSKSPGTASTPPAAPAGTPDLNRYLPKPVAARGTDQASSAMLGDEPSKVPNELAARLESTELRPASASMLRDRNFLITKGTNLDCALEEAIVTALPGLITCRLSQDVYSDNGQVLLLERGTQLVGEQQGNVQRGHARVFALFTRAKTPHGVVINLDSPGTDALGRSGLEGWVDHHFAERFGAAIMVSLIQDTMKALIAREQSRGGTTVYTGSAESGSQVVEKILESTVNIPPTVVKNHGDHIQVKIARDLDFSTVYALQAR
jgi:type IV secretion system protein VirB10